MPDPIERLNAAPEGRYRIERELGEGGYAYGEDVRHERRMAMLSAHGARPDENKGR